MGRNSQARRAPKPTEERIPAKPMFVARIADMSRQIDALVLERDKAIEMGAVAMGLTPEKGQLKWMYDVAKGEFHRAKRSR